MKKSSKSTMSYTKWGWILLLFGIVGFIISFKEGSILGSDLTNVLFWPMIITAIVLFASSYFGFRSKSTILNIISVFSAILGIFVIYALFVNK